MGNHIYNNKEKNDVLNYFLNNHDNRVKTISYQLCLQSDKVHQIIDDYLLELKIGFKNEQTREN